ncbi:MAG: FAD-dependent oxidoreductase [Vicinamibacteria bacterium]
MAKPVILAVDDDPEVLGAIARDLRQHYGRDYRIVRAGSGDLALEALKELAERDEPVALLLSDQRMPQMDGVGFLSAARATVPGAKRALLTAYADTDAAIGAINQSQVDYYLLKPWDPPEERLYPVLDDLLEDWRASYRPGYEGVRVVGDRWSPRSHDIRDFLARNQVPYEFQDVETSQQARELLERSKVERNELPLVVLPGGESLRAPTINELAARVGLKTHAAAPFYDLAIVGAGPAGLAAAVYGASEGLRTVLVEREAPGGQAGTSSRIENYLGFPSGVSGGDLARRAVTQARKFGVEILTPQDAVSLRVEGPYKHLSLGDGSEIASHALMLATGVAWRRLPAENADALTGRGVFYGAAMTEAVSCKDEVVYTVGASNSAGQAALYFAQYARRVVMLLRGSIESKTSQYLVDRLRSTPNIEIRTPVEVQACHGMEKLEALTIANRETGETETLEARYLFAFIGASPRTQWLEGVIELDPQGFIFTGPDLDRSTHLGAWPFERAPYLLEASVPGIFAAGDVRHESVKRVASAVGEGSVAVHFIHRYLASL